MWLFLLFVLVPLVEIALFIVVGGWLTLWPTLALVLLTAIVGTWLVRQEGLRVLRDLERALDRLDDPLAPLAHGFLVLVAGLLLLTPGFLTDAVGLALLVPAVRTRILSLVARHGLHRRMHVRAAAWGGGAARYRPDDAVIDAEFHEVRPEPAASGRNPGGTTPPRG